MSGERPGGTDERAAVESIAADLRRMTPMPPDEHLNPTLLRIYGGVLDRIAALPGQDARLLSPLIRSLGPGEGRGAFERAISWIETFPPEVAAPPLIEALEGGSVGQRRWAAIALGRLGDLSALPPLRRALEDRSAIVRGAADLAVRMLESLAKSQAPPPGEDSSSDPLFHGLTE